jgi:hypothetical protein
MRNIILLICFLSSSLFAQEKIGGAGSDLPSPKPTKVNLCEVIAAPQKFVDKRIHFVGTIDSALAMATPTLSHGLCRGKFVSFSGDSEEINRQIDENLEVLADGISTRGEFEFVGFLRRLQTPEGRDIIPLPVTGMIPNFSMRILSVEKVIEVKRRKNLIKEQETRP